jgi:hypothetical protein
MPLSQSCPIERRDPTKSGKTWAVRAPNGRVGKFRSPMWVDLVVAPSGRETVMKSAPAGRRSTSEVLSGSAM